MITFPHIGFIGRLGNQMFQYSALLGISKKHNLYFCLSKTNLELYECFNIPAKISSYINPDFSSPNNFDPTNCTYFTVNVKDEMDYCKILSTHFDDKFFNQNHNNKSILGFFQNFKYFENVKEELKEHFSFREKYRKISENYIQSRFESNDIISLHIRRTDYLKSTVLNNLNINYYESALKYFDKKLPVLVFSDDIEWCKQQKFFSDDRFFIMESNDTYIDLCLMSLCKYHIIANSTYSWWGAWLANSKRTICPKIWFSEPYSFLDSEGLRLPNWISV